MRKRNSGVINAKNVIYFIPDKFQYPSVQEPKTYSQKQKDRAEFHRNRLKESGKEITSGNALAFIVFRFSDNRRRDLDGAASTVFDALVDAGIIKDDSVEEITGFCVTSAKCAKGEEGVDIILIEP